MISEKLKEEEMIEKEKGDRRKGQMRLHQKEMVCTTPSPPTLYPNKAFNCNVAVQCSDNKKLIIHHIK